MTDVALVNGGWNFIGYKGKGGGASRPPVEAPDSLHSTSYARVLDLLSEGPVKGLADGLKSVYLDQTPIQNPDGSLNFSGVAFDFRNGTQFQDHIPGFPASESTSSVGVELKYGTPWVRAINNPVLSAVRITLGANGLSKADTSNGNINGYRVAYAIDVQSNGGAWVEVVSSAFSGKTTSSYRRTHRINLPQGASPWQVRVRRLTANANSQAVADTTVIESISEVVDGKLRYPMSALAGLQLDASQFSSVPTRAYDMYGRIIRVPSNYDPVTRTYTGVWNGTFKNEYSNNPAWVFYDLVTDKLFGLGNKIPEAWVNKWKLYEIAAYCDEMVPDGRGGVEPRFEANIYLQTQEAAYKVLQDFVSIFRGLVYWSAGAAVPVADMPRDYIYTYTQANVIEGEFIYSGSRLKDRATVAFVSYSDREDFGRQKVVYYQDDEAVARYGIRKIDLTAFGCTSESQALRMAKWALLTSKRETESVSFSVGLDGTLVAPGSIVRIADANRAGRRIGGRIRSATLTTVELDSDLKAVPGDELTVIMPNGVAETRPVRVVWSETINADSTEYRADTTRFTADVTAKPGATKTLVVDPPFSQVPPPESVWALESESLKTQLFTVVSVTENDDGATFDISAVQHEPGKYAAIDYGTKLDPRPVTVIPARVQAAPDSISLTSREVLAQGVSSTVVAVEWSSADGAVAYELEWRRDDSDWVRVGQQQTTRHEIANAFSGTYVARVRAINSIKTPSNWKQSEATAVTGLLTAPLGVTSLTAKSKPMAIELAWGFPTGLNILERTEVWYSATSDRLQGQKLGDFAYPQKTHTLMGLAAGVSFYFWARLVDKNGLPGPWNANGVLGKSSTDANELLSYLTGQINETQLAQELKTEIAKIPALETQGGQNAAAIQTEATTRANADSALAQNISTVQATANGASASAQAALTAISDTNEQLSAMYTVKVQLNSNGAYHFAGFGVGVENIGGVLQSQFLVQADRFAILPATTSSAASAVSPFVVQNGQVFIKSAVIADASITSAKIADASITSAKIGNAEIKSANIEDGAISNAKIGNAAITSAKIGDAQVDTLKIAGNAVTIPVSAYTSGDVVLIPSAVWVNLQTLYVPANLGPTQVLFGVQVKTNNAEVTVRVLKDGVPLVIQTNVPSGSFNFMTLDTSWLGGSYAVETFVSYQGTRPEFTHRYINALVVKR